VFLLIIQCNNPSIEVEFMVRNRAALLKMASFVTGVDTSKTNGPLSAGAMQLEEGSHLELKE
jgi:hypothetical protein